MRSPYATHQQLLVRTALKTTGTILELGSGWYSTPVLHEIATAMGRRLITVDNDPEWLATFEVMRSDLHELISVSSWDQFKPAEHYGMAFVDHAPGERRSIEMNRLRGRVDVFVIHDTEAAGYGFEKSLPTFQHIETDKSATPWTSLYR